jgi:hypothetical protein
MNDAELNRIIEETFQNIVRNEGPSLFQSLSSFVHDLSHNVLEDNMPRLHVQETSSIIDLSLNPQPNEQLEDFSRRWFQQLNNYHTCMRDYHKNMVQMNRITNSLLLNITSERTPFFLQPPTRNTIEIQGFSIPLSNQQAQAQTQTQTQYPNISQVIESTHLFIYNEQHIEEGGMETRCPISLEDFVLGDELCEIRNCRHVFKWTNLQSWFSRHSNCPVCRFDIRRRNEM